jgi:DNA-directed RNA polymerase specialized sigma24 family protein
LPGGALGTTLHHCEGTKLSENLQRGSFPLTRYSVVLAAESDDPAVRLRAIDAIASAYWKPVYKYVRMKWRVEAEDAADFTQDFFARLLEKEFLGSYDSRKGRLRTFLRTCADRLFMNQTRDSGRLKRGAGSPHLSLDFEEAEQEFATMSRSESPEDYFDKEWVRSLFALGVQRLQASCESGGKMIHFELFQRYDLEDSDSKPSYAQLAVEFGLAATDVTNYLAFARREFRRCVLEQLREMTATEEEFRREARALLGVEPR